MIKKILIALLVATLTGCVGGDGKGGESNGGESLPPLTAPYLEVPIALDSPIVVVSEGEVIDIPDDIEPETIGEIVYRDDSTNGLSREDINRAPDFSYDEFIIAYELASKEWPNLDKDSDDFANKIIDNLIFWSVPKMKARYVEGIFDEFNELTVLEKTLVITNPIKAYKSKKAADAAKEATTLLFSGELHLTRADAFRHSYWNWLMSECCSVAWAWAFATAHETEQPNSDDRRMDLNNNIIGRNLYRSSPSSGKLKARRELLNYNVLWVNSSLSNVKVGVDYLVYLSPSQIVSVSTTTKFKAIYTVTFNGMTFDPGTMNFKHLASGDHLLKIRCENGNNMCNLSVSVLGAMTSRRIGVTGLRIGYRIQLGDSEEFSLRLNFPVMMKGRRW